MTYRIFGIELSPYSVKVRSYCRYKNIDHEWIVRSAATMAEFQKYARLPLVPLVVTPEDEGWQDSTPILEKLEKRFPEPALQPADPALAFVSALIEEYADEWGNKEMFHYRWWYEPDQRASAERIAKANLPDADAAALEKTAQAIVARMVPRLSFVGSHEGTKPIIEESLANVLKILEAHLEVRPFLFGGRPALGDFGLWAQLYEASIDPTVGALMRDRAPRTLDWIQRMLEPRGDGGFEAWDALAPTLEPLLREQVAGLFLPWSTANARALAKGEGAFEVELGGRPFRQETQKYHARSLGVLRERYAGVPDRAPLDAILERTGCLEWLRA